MKWKGSLDIVDAGSHVKTALVKVVKRSSTPSSDTSVGQIYTKNDGHAYFLPPTGGEVDLLAGGVVDSGITTSKLADSAVTGRKMVAFTGDTGSGGTRGAVPAPAVGDATKFLRGNGTWATTLSAIADSSITTSKIADSAITTKKIANTSVTGDKMVAFTGDTGSGGAKGAVPAPATGDATKFLRGDGNWATTLSTIANSSISTAKIADSAVTSRKQADSSTTTRKLANTAVTTAKLKDSAVTTAKQADSSTTSKKLANSAVTTAKIANLAISSVKLANNAVINSKIMSSTITGSRLDDSTITSRKQADSSTTTRKIANTSVTTAKLANGSVNSAKMKASTLTLQGLVVTGNATMQGTTFLIQASNIITRDNMIQLNSGQTGTAITSIGIEALRGPAATASIFYDETAKCWKIDNGQGAGSLRVLIDKVTNAQITDSAVSTAKLATSSVTTSKLANTAVTTVKIKDSNVTTAKLASSNVTTAKLRNSNVTTAKLANNAVTTVKVLDSNITTAKLNGNAVTTVKILDSNVTTAKLANSSVTASKLVAFTGDSGSGGTKGAVPAPAAGDAAAGKFLKADGTWSVAGGSSASTAAKETLTQASHGFAAKDAIYYTGSAYAKAKADLATTAEAVGVVESVNGNDFVVVYEGRVSGLSGLTSGSVYFVSEVTAGLLTATEPGVGNISKPMLVATSTTSGIVINMRGVLVEYSGGLQSVKTYKFPSVTVGQTAFSLPWSYSIGSGTLFVIRNGIIQLLTSDYTETSVSSFTLVTAITATDEEMVAIRLPNGAGAPSIVTLTDAATIAVDLSLGNNFTVTLGGSRTLGAPSSAVAGMSGSIIVKQDGSGGRTLAYNSAWKFAGGTAPTLSTAINAVDLLAYVVESSSIIRAVMSSQDNK